MTTLYVLATLDEYMLLLVTLSTGYEAARIEYYIMLILYIINDVKIADVEGITHEQAFDVSEHKTSD